MFRLFYIGGLICLWTALYAQNDSLPGSGEKDTLPEDVLISVPLFSALPDDIEGAGKSQDVSSLLHASGDLFNSVAGYAFGSVQRSTRGYGSENTAFLINGVPLNDPENGWADWSLVAGLNDLTRNSQSGYGAGPSDYHFGGIGGSANMDLRASRYGKGARLSYALTNRSYRHRLMLTHSTGQLGNGWSVIASGSVRYAKEGYADGTFYSAASYFVSAEKRINPRHAIGFTGLGAPVVRGIQGVAVQEAYDLAGTNYYNPNWGYQNGEKRNARVRHDHTPLFLLSHYWDVNEKLTVNTSFAYVFGRSGQTGLNWYDAKDPRPDYYRYLPSYFKEEDTIQYEVVKQNWISNVVTRQINWDQLYFANSKSLYSVQNADGQTGNTVTGNRSKYILEEYRTDPSLMALSPVMRMRLNERWSISAGTHLLRYRSRNFKKAEDLLGGDFWVDVDQFAEQDFEDPNVAQNDLNQPNHVVRKGDKFGYDYRMNINNALTFGQLNGTIGKFDLYAGAMFSATSFWRTGFLLNGRFPENSLGDSEKNSYFTGGLKAGAVYKLTGRHYFSVNAAWFNRPPYTRYTFLSPRTRDNAVEGATPVEVRYSDFSYHLRYPDFRTSLTLFYTEVNNQTWARTFYHDEYRNFVNYTMTGVNNLFTGVEWAAETNLLSPFAVKGAFTAGNYLWNSRPLATIVRDNSTEILAENRTIYLKNYKLSGIPEVAAIAGLKYNARRYWFAEAGISYFSGVYADVNPDRRTAQAVVKYVITDPQWGKILDQQKLGDIYTVDVSGGKSWKFGKYFLSIFLTASNVLNNIGFIRSGFEQLRYDANDINKFPAKYSYMYGTTYYVMATLRF